MKKILDSRLLLVVLIFLLALGVRFYNFEDRINFGPEQAISLAVSGDYLKDKFSLLGQPNIQRTTSNGHIIYSPAMFNYSLVPLLITFNYNPLPITYYFAFLNLATALILFLLIKKISEYKIALFSLVLFLFNSTMIYHSTFIWTHHYIPIVNIFVFYLLYRFHSNQNLVTPFFLGVLTSFSLSPEYFYVFTMVAVVGLMVYFSKRKLFDTFTFSLGAILGSLPTILFDLKHQFYHLSTLWQYAIDTFYNPGRHSISYYHFLQFWPLLALFGGLLLSFLYTRNRFFAFSLLGVYLFLNLTSGNVSLTRAIGMDEGMTMSKINQAAEVISKDQPKNFNVASTLQFDTNRAYPLRYFLRFQYGVTPKGVEEYKNLDSLYVLGGSDYNFKESSVWEIAEQSPFKVIELKKIDANWSIFKLAKQ